MKETELSSVADPRYNSMSSFANSINKFSIHELVSSKKKKNVLLPEGNFSIRPFAFQSVDEKNQLYMMMDGQYGFGLFFQKQDEERPYFLALASFSPISHAADSPRLKRYKETFDKYSSDENPIILQLQGQHYYTNGRSDIRRLTNAHQVLDTFRWEHVLTNITIQWAQMVNIETLYILPGSLFKITLTGNRLPTEEELNRRYNGSARKYGFKPDNNKIYKLKLQ